MKFLIFLGTMRDSAQPNPPRLGLRVARACVAQLHQDNISAELIDPLDFDPGPIFKPHFAYAQCKGTRPAPVPGGQNRGGGWLCHGKPGIQSFDESRLGAFAQSLRQFAVFVQAQRDRHLFGGAMGWREGGGGHAVFSVGAGLLAGFGDGADSQGA